MMSRLQAFILRTRGAMVMALVLTFGALFAAITLGAVVADYLAAV
jgi:hypothetical protein